MDKDSVIKKAKEITSAISINEAGALYDYSHCLADNSIFVEIGSYLGCSSTIIGSVAKEKNCKFFMIDPFYETDINVCRQNIESRGVTDAVILHKTSKEALKKFKKESIDFLFIDGDHWYEGVRFDCEKYIPKVKTGGHILFHDYKSSWDGVKQAVDEQKNLHHLALIDSLLVTRKI